MNIHDHPTRKVGLRPSDPDRLYLRLADFLTGEMPDVSEKSDYLHKAGLTFGLYRNDQFGICGPTSVCNYRRGITAWLTGRMVAPSQAACEDLYRRSGNPGFNPATGADDNGVDMARMLQAVMAGGIDGVKCLGYARVDVSNVGEMERASTLFGGLLLGVDLQKAQQAQTDRGYWDYSPSGTWGGHAVYQGAATPDKVITWAEEVEMKPPFIQHQLSEAWAVIFPEHLSDYGFVAGIDLGLFAQAFEAVTGRKFPASVPPPIKPLDFDLVGRQD